ncbi:centromere protein C isoform X1 [Vitis riparia]|uniref:centromere protein C isoform X1 n=1 Tax=Vitis riparia TaxID=96939 RepID=UPI00155A49D3|nr:centromere protein C isoform X1 [Vitis riparia]XP_034696748.1 centromere protein C isoform X1 [Vitis riparia]
MANDRRSSDLVDPLLGYFGLSLFPRTFRDSSTVSKPSGRDNIESLHSYLQSMALRSPTKLLEQAKSILDGGSELLNPNFPSDVASEDNCGPISEKLKENPPERRPALGRKRARFSLKPDSSQPTMVLEPSLDIDKLQDPEEYFLAHEKLENAKKELQRQRGGVLMDLNQYNLSTTARHRRPGILGRSVSYKHHYSSLVSDNDENLMPSPATVEQKIVSPSNYSSQVEMVDPNVALQERELTETVDPSVESLERELTVSVTQAENKVDEILDELLSGNCQDLDGDGALTFLQERLQIKPIDLDKLCLPELHDIQRNDFKSSGGNWLRHRDSLSDIKTMLEGLSSKTPIKKGQVVESFVHTLASPTPPKSPFASICLLKRHILQSNLTSDPFSVLKVNLSPARNSSTVKSSDKQSDQIDNGKELSFSAKLKSVILEGDDIAVANKSSHEVVHVITGDSTPPFEKAVNNDSRILGVGINSGLSGSHADLDGNIRSNDVDDLRRLDADTDVQINRTNELEDNSSTVKSSDKQSDQIDNGKELSFSAKLKSVILDDIAVANKSLHEVVHVITGDSTPPSEKAVNNDSRRLGVGINSRLSGSHADLDGNIRSNNVDDLRRLDADTDVQINRTNELEDKVGDMLQEAEPRAHPDQNIEDSTLEQLNSSESQGDQPTPAVVEAHDMDGPSKTGDDDPEQCTEKILEPSGESLNKRSKEKTPPHRERKRKEISGRQSLAGAGTLWSSGVRRSTRIKMRPLEYWKGERFLYGRVHKSLTTVIGVKYVSPAKGDGKPTIKVKSYVSDEYKELVDLAALH